MDCTLCKMQKRGIAMRQERVKLNEKYRFAIFTVIVKSSITKIINIKNN